MLGQRPPPCCHGSCDKASPPQYRRAILACSCGVRASSEPPTSLKAFNIRSADLGMLPRGDMRHQQQRQPPPAQRSSSSPREPSSQGMPPQDPASTKPAAPQTQDPPQPSKPETPQPEAPETEPAGPTPHVADATNAQPTDAKSADPPKAAAADAGPSQPAPAQSAPAQADKPPAGAGAAADGDGDAQDSSSQQANGHAESSGVLSEAGDAAQALPNGHSQDEAAAAELQKEAQASPAQSPAAGESVQAAEGPSEAPTAPLMQVASWAVRHRLCRRQQAGTLPCSAACAGKQQSLLHMAWQPSLCYLH